MCIFKARLGSEICLFNVIMHNLGYYIIDPTCIVFLIPCLCNAYAFNPLTPGAFYQKRIFKTF